MEEEEEESKFSTEKETTQEELKNLEELKILRYSIF